MVESGKRETRRPMSERKSGGYRIGQHLTRITTTFDMVVQSIGSQYWITELPLHTGTCGKWFYGATLASQLDWFNFPILPSFNIEDGGSILFQAQPSLRSAIDALHRYQNVDFLESLL